VKKPSGGPALAVVYTAIAIVMTWPLARHLGTRLPADLGDPVFNCWVLMWTAGQVLAAFQGHPGALANFWNGNVFYPEPLTLAYSEHLTGQMLQILPVYAVTGNIILCYSLLFIASFALSGLAMYLLVRDLTNRPPAAFLAGLAFAYAPYRLGQFPHLQILTCYWMPLALFGFRRFFVTNRARPLAGGSIALVMQNLSCGYFMLFFAPFAAAYCGYEIVQRRRLRDWPMWGKLAIAAVAMALATWPFVRPYFQLRDVASLGVRSPGEIVMFSADAHAFATIAPNSRLLSDAMSGFPKPEGEGFVGLSILAFALIGVVFGLRRLLAGVPWRTLPEWHVLAIGAAGVVFLGSVVALVLYFVNGRLVLPFVGDGVIRRNATEPLTFALGSLMAFALLVSLARRRARAIAATAFGFFAVAVLAAAIFAMGPKLQALGHDLGPGPYRWLLNLLPGFDGLRVPARFLMLVALFLAALAGLGAAALLDTRARRFALVAIAAGSVGILAESWFAPLQLNQPIVPAPGFRLAAAPVTGRAINPIYQVIRDLPDPAVLVELPFGEPAYESLAVFYAGYHRRPILNGYSGFFPQSYLDRISTLHELPDHRDEAAALLRSAGVTHVLVHEGAFIDARGREISEWLTSIGAHAVATNGMDKLFAFQ
jgi:hypothetical protein